MGGLIIAGAMLLASCASTNGSDDRTVLEWYVQPLNSTSIWPDLADAFNESQDEIKVEITVGPTNVDTVRGALSTQIGSGSETPDVYEGDITWPAQFAEAGLALNLSEVLPEEFWHRFAPGAVSFAQYNGVSYSVPSWTEAAFLYYRSDLLEEAGKTVPETWEELLETAKAIQDSGAASTGYLWQGAGYEGLTCVWNELIADAGGGIVDDAYTTGQMDSAAGEKALAFLAETISSGVSPAATVNFEEPETLNEFLSGDAVFMRNWSYAWAITQDADQSNVVGKVGMAPLPTFEGQAYPGASTNGGGGMYINPHSENIDAAITFLDWLTDVEAQSMFASIGKVLPANLEAQTPEAKQHVGPVGDVLADLTIVGRPVGTPGYSELSRAVFQNINAALTGTVSLEQGLENADNDINKVMSRSD